MNADYLLASAEAALTRAWIKAGTLYGFSRIGSKPTIELNNRLRTTMGRAWIEANKIDVATRFMVSHYATMLNETIPHEVAHHIAYRLYGDPGHGKAWKQIMRDFGLNPSPYIVG